MSFDIHPVRTAGSIRPHAEAPRQDQTTRPDIRANAGETPAVAVEADSSLIASGPPIDTDRVREIRKALAEGTYPLKPARVADAMIAAKFMLSTHV